MKIIKTLFELLFSIVIFSSNSFAQPVWEISSQWFCKQHLHSVISKNGKVKSINRNQKDTIIDFKNSKYQTIFDNGNVFTGKLISKFYIHNPNYRNESIFVVDFGKYSIGETTQIMIERNNEFWHGYTSEYSTEDLWTSHSKCYPTG